MVAALELVVMGVSGSGKSTIGSLLAAALGGGFVDADDLHPRSNVDQMAAGIPLTDDDRWPWLDLVASEFRTTDSEVTVVACSALKRSYRDRMRRIAPRIQFVYLANSRDTLAARMAQRGEHFMPPALLESQLATSNHSRTMSRA